MKKYMLITAGLLQGLCAGAQIYVAGGGELTNFSTVDLATPAGSSWGTERSATPGYFSAIGSATYTGAADNANINGYVKYYANSTPAASFTFPTGTGTDLRSLTIGGTIPGAGVYAAAWMAGDPGGVSDPTDGGTHGRTALSAGIQSISAVGSWDFQDISGDAMGLTITVSIPNSSAFATAANIRLVGWNGTQWVNLSSSQGNAAASGNAENSTLTGTLVAGITAIGIGSTVFALPVQLTRFSAVAVDNRDALLNWQVQNERNISRYELERSRTATTDFAKVGTVVAGQSGADAYSFTDVDAVKNGLQLYYRLKVVEDDGSWSYSSVVPVRFRNETGIRVYPSPVRAGEPFTVQLGGTERDRFALRLLNTAGQLLFRQDAAGDTRVKVETSGLAAGTYFLHVEGPELSQAIKQVVE